MGDIEWIVTQLQKIRAAIDYIADVPVIEPISLSRKNTLFDKMSLSEKAMFLINLARWTEQ